MMNQEHFAKKITAYLDGTLKDGERTEFEAFVGGNPEFAALFRKREQEQQSLKLRIPDFAPDADAVDVMSREVKEAIAHLFTDDEAGVTTRLANWFKEKL